MSFTRLSAGSLGRSQGLGMIAETMILVADLDLIYVIRFLAHLSRRLKGELIVYRSIRRPCVRACVRASVNIFKLEYLRNQWANRNQILSEASLG